MARSRKRRRHRPAREARAGGADESAGAAGDTGRGQATGERPTALTVGAIVALALAAAAFIPYVLGAEIRGERPSLLGVVPYVAVMLVAAWGQWHSRYWAVLGMEALLGITIVMFCLFALLAQNWLALLLVIGIVVPAGILFWFLAKSLSQLEMPERR